MLDTELIRRIRLMTARQLAERIADVEQYMHNISPRLSRYQELSHERKLLWDRYRELHAPTPAP